jgi:hypothetical protein
LAWMEKLYHDEYDDDEYDDDENGDENHLL